MLAERTPSSFDFPEWKAVASLKISNRDTTGGRHHPEGLTLPSTTSIIPLAYTDRLPARSGRLLNTTACYPAWI